MSGESEPKKAKDNTGLEPKPEGVQQPGAAPKGHLGHRPATPAPGGTVQPRTATQKLEQSGPQQTQAGEDNRPIAQKTGVPEIDKQSEERGQQLMTFDEIKAKSKEMEAVKEASQKSEGPQVSQSDYAKAFRQAAGEQERQKQQQQSKGFDLE